MLLAPFILAFSLCNPSSAGVLWPALPSCSWPHSTQAALHRCRAWIQGTSWKRCVGADCSCSGQCSCRGGTHTKAVASEAARGVAKSPLWAIHCFDRYMLPTWQTPQVLLMSCFAVRKSGNLPTALFFHSSACPFERALAHHYLTSGTVFVLASGA